MSSAEEQLTSTHRIQAPDTRTLPLLLVFPIAAAVCLFLQVLAQLCDLLHSQRV
jgi:hypothetical protein